MADSAAQPTEQPADFSFMTGSCAHIDPALQDKSGILYRGDTAIFYSMAHSGADFMLWLGDNWYLGDAQTKSKEGLNEKASSVLSNPAFDGIRKAMPNYAIWDDHDYGPNDSYSNYPLKSESRNIFMRTWTNNPSFGKNNEGIYTSFLKEDVLFVLLDDRWWRSSDRLPSHKAFKPNTAKQMFGRQQMDWLKSTLLQYPQARFKIIVTGSQVLNPRAKGDCLFHFPAEYQELMDFLNASEIPGVLFLTGDRHHGEIIKQARNTLYPLYDITASPISSDVDPVHGREKHNDARVAGTLVQQHHFAQISFTGSGVSRTLSVVYRDNRGRELATWQVSAQELGWKD